MVRRSDGFWEDFYLAASLALSIFGPPLYHYNRVVNECCDFPVVVGFEYRPVCDMAEILLGGYQKPNSGLSGVSPFHDVD